MELTVWTALLVVARDDFLDFLSFAMFVSNFVSGVEVHTDWFTILNASFGDGIFSTGGGLALAFISPY